MPDRVPVKAYILNEDTNERLECLFNPTQYSFAVSSDWRSESLPGQQVPQTHYHGAGPATMSFELFFDTYAPVDPDAATRQQIARKDVRDYTEKLLTYMKVDPNTVQSDAASAGRPPVCSFHWGNYWTFKGVITAVNLTFTLFDGTGKPVRARANVTLQQIQPEGLFPAQNPTSGGDGMRARHMVEDGDTLDLIAYQEYGDPTRWRAIALANGIDNPRALRAGQRLVIPSL